MKHRMRPLPQQSCRLASVWLSRSQSTKFDNPSSQIARARSAPPPKDPYLQLGRFLHHRGAGRPRRRCRCTDHDPLRPHGAGDRLSARMRICHLIVWPHIRHQPVSRRDLSAVQSPVERADRRPSDVLGRDARLAGAQRGALRLPLCQCPVTLNIAAGAVLEPAT